MKNQLFITISLMLFAFAGQAQVTLASQKGVSLSYSEEYVNSVVCGRDNDKYDQYKVTVYLENGSGHTINISNSWILHNSETTACGNGPAAAYIDQISRWRDNSSVTRSYYVLVRPGTSLSVSTWRMGGFDFVD